MPSKKYALIVTLNFKVKNKTNKVWSLKNKWEIKNNTYLIKSGVFCICHLTLKNLFWDPPPTNMPHYLYLNILKVLCERFICKICARVHIIRVTFIKFSTKGIKQSKKSIFQWWESKVSVFFWWGSVSQIESIFKPTIIYYIHL